MFTQLILDLGLKDGFTFDNFVTGDNALLIDFLKSQNADVEKQVYIWGVHSTGKTHLLQALCQYYSHEKVSYLPLSQLIEYSPEIFQGQELMDVCCIDDVQLLQNKRHWQEALFDLINRAREYGTRLIISATQPPVDIGIDLKDLVSRLQWGPVFKLNELNDAQKCEALQRRAEGRGFDLPGNVASYLLNNCRREIADLYGVLDTLDNAQLQQHRKLTIPFVKSVLEK